MPTGIYFPGYSEADANPDMGDSAIVETIGLGAFAMAAAPAVVGYVGAGRPSEAASFTRAMAVLMAGAGVLGSSGATQRPEAMVPRKATENAMGSPMTRPTVDPGAPISRPPSSRTITTRRTSPVS